MFLALVVGMRRLPPTRLAAAAAASGLLAGGLGATICGLYCEETSAAVVATSYTLGVAFARCWAGWPGPRLLKW